MNFSPQQDKALDAVAAWLRVQDKPVFYLAGYAGTGKTSLAKYFSNGVDGQVLFASFTGKAASVMRAKGCLDAKTIHSLIYHPREKSGETLRRLEADLECLQLQDPPDLDLIERKKEDIAREKKNLKQPAFELNPDSDLRGASLLIIDECFVRGTPVDTPKGPRPIEILSPGDRILNAAGTDVVIAISRKKVTSAAKVVCGTTTFVCSENHRFFTGRGVICASALKPGDSLLKTTEAMRLLRKGILSEESTGPILSKGMCGALDASLSRDPCQDIHSRTKPEMRRCQEEMVSEEVPQSHKGIATYRGNESDSESRGLSEDKSNTKNDETSAPRTGGKWTTHSNSTKTIGLSFRRQLASGIRSPHQGTASLLQDRHCQSKNEDCHRSRRTIPLFPKTPRTRPTKNQISNGSRVDSVEILEQGSPELDQFRDADGALYLYDLQAARHPSFSIYGCLVHNCSMVGEQMGIDLLAFEVPVLVLGDPAQLPPVRSAGFFTNRMPDVMLTEIHRQEADNPIIEMATRVREGRGLPYGRYGDSQVLRLSEFDRDATIRSGVQILVGRNETRRRANARVRAARGFTDVLPVPGDRLVCCRNDHDVGLLNGTIWSVDSVLGTGDDTQYLRILGEDGGDLVVEVHQAPFHGEEVPPWIRREAEEFDFGYALTCHKAQGSQWDEVVIVDESACFRQDANRWAYTAITRASKRVTVVR